MFNWGLIGGGWISSKFAKGLTATDDMCVHALASASGRNPFGIEPQVTYSSYDELIADEKVDAVYIGLLNHQHYPVIKQCLMAKKPVLCEKPITINAKELEELLQIAKEQQVFFMEAMWTRFLPASDYLCDIFQNEKYGKVCHMHMTFGSEQKMSIPRLEKPEFGGGALLDLGVYSLSLADYWLGDKLEKINAAWADLSEDKIDLTSGATLTYEKGTLVETSCSIRKNLPNDVYVVTDEAEFRIPYYWKAMQIQRFIRKNNFEENLPVEVLNFDFPENGYQFEAWEVKRCVEAGLLESEKMSWADSLKIMKLMDELRKQYGVVYPQD